MARRDPNRVTIGEHLAEYPPPDPILRFFGLVMLSVAGGAIFGLLSATSSGAAEGAGIGLFAGMVVGLVLSPVPAICLRRTDIAAVVGHVGLPTAVLTVVGGISGDMLLGDGGGLPLSFLLSVGSYVTLSIIVGLWSNHGYRRADRRACGHCLKCGYDRWGIDGPCPECGMPN